ncbi:NADH dehydrogenase subunit M [Nitrosococcus oceani ATCC 19707]|uniref:NADH-quinone oxidoreductase subunit M n=2 Tax=Nitrosococcus oceani TaxID=1229 RepID=Q3J840_NITOC|nr:NADH-quinone oxidoreductase subunit M [Nitrosococcus oceani]ABA59006.1 NADH dehydrogenase subunit M [Nitrosococcus oceani ATCC 19707]EDZ65334.1 proton-translocating NADH-quinone oxidoreductase, chain M subfamily [Nitrosococcus oceani AFC27]KFI18528.1 NADH:ubiquinone oxidoreductase subunit M [Nitrosococcus oceani C-27]GEM21232.1 NADH-quinone oxidoreductase subunit M [Nitrosococcus oceani]
MLTGLPLLSLVIWLPILGGFLVLAVGNHVERVRWLSLGVSGLTFVVSWSLYTGFDISTATMQFQEKLSWVEAFDVYYHLGIDGISMPLIILTTFSTVLVVIAGWRVIEHKLAQYMASFLIMEGLMNGVFAALDAVLFYFFFEGMLIPLFLIIGIWGGPNRIYATLKFFLYTFLGSVFFLLALLYLRSVTGGFSILEFHQVPLDMQAQIGIFLAFLLAFAVKVPMWPVHTWLPDAHVEAPTGGSVILAAITLKIGAYGFMRFSLPITPDASMALNWLIITLSLIAVVYIGLVAIVQEDLKKLIAYSSIAHMGFVTLGLFIAFAIFSQGVEGDGALLGLEGALVQMISHGLVSAAMFLCVGVLYDRLHTRLIKDYGGVVNKMPIFASFMVLFAMANVGLPGTSGFVGEFLVILGAFQADFWYAFFASMTLILGATYTLWMVKRVVFGDIANDKVATMEDLNSREFLVLGTLAAAVLLLGVWPQPLLEVMHTSLENLLSQMAASKLV